MGKVSIADGEELLFLEKKIPLITGRPFKFLRHGQGVDRAGLDAHAAEKAPSHVHLNPV